MNVAKMVNNQVSVLGSSYCQPIADLVDRWGLYPARRSNAVASSLPGYAASIILLLVAMFESYVVRVRYIQRANIPANKRMSAYDVISHLYPRLRHRKALMDVYVLRDAIFHNHLWEIEYSWGNSPAMVLHGAVKDSACGDKKYDVRVNPTLRRTKALGLSVIPTRVDRHDVRKVFITIWKTLLFFESKNRNQCYVSHLDVKLRGNLLRFGDLIKYL